MYSPYCATRHMSPCLLLFPTLTNLFSYILSFFADLSIWHLGDMATSSVLDEDWESRFLRKVCSLGSTMVMTRNRAVIENTWKRVKILSKLTNLIL